MAGRVWPLPRSVRPRGGAERFVGCAGLPPVRSRGFVRSLLRRVRSRGARVGRVVRPRGGTPLLPPDFVDQLRAGARARGRTRPKGPALAAVDDLTGPAGLRLRRYRAFAEGTGDALADGLTGGDGPGVADRLGGDPARTSGGDATGGDGLTGGGSARSRGEGPRRGGVPLVVYLHGGGFVFCDLDTHDRTCRRIARACGVDVLAVDYRLAPEHPHPAALDDAVAVLRWARPAAVAGD
ncbi:MAG: alpha/beta hydrolase fold domain-containing protein, partial [Streptomyces sp.]|nr:alpha/beta hydrolase fold domain-containing protein [Streptomyces sp.]